MARQSTPKRSKLPYVILGLVVIAAVVTVLEVTNMTHFFHSANPPGTQANVQGEPSSKAPPPKNPKTPSSTTNNGTATDNNGQVPSGVSNNPSQWAVSTSGAVTLKSPLKNSTLKSGDTITGAATSSTVQYRLIDDQVGVLAQGAISVVNGSFSASINFKPYASSGRLDIFNIDANGKEINEVQVPVNF